MGIFILLCYSIEDFTSACGCLLVVVVLLSLSMGLRMDQKTFCIQRYQCAQVTDFPCLSIQEGALV